MTINKIYSGDLVGTGIGQMLSHRTAKKGSAGYVALEVVTATLDGKTGTFVLQHVGIMNRGESFLTVSIIPDSGTDELVGITGQFEIDSTKKPHPYTLTYSFSD